MYTSDEILYTTLGDTYKSLKRYAEAEQAYKHAYYVVPHKLYPRYLLANLYRETGKKEEAIRTAKSILNQKIKVHSTATEEIIKEMQDLITALTIE
jgi:tetratricopeptide (TPR) repeat protein